MRGLNKKCPQGKRISQRGMGCDPSRSHMRNSISSSTVVWVTMSIHLQNHLIYSSIIEKFTSTNTVHNPAVHVEATWYIDMIWWWEPHKTSGTTGRKHKLISQHNRQSQSYTPPHSASMHRLDGIMGMVPRWVIFQTPRVRDTWRRMTESQPLSKLYSDRVWLVMN